MSYMDHGVSKIVPLLGCHVTLLPDIVNAAGHEDAPGSLAPENRDHVAALDRLDLPPERITNKTEREGSGPYLG